MSDFDDELLELVEASGKERKRKRGSSGKSKGSKRRKADVSDDEPESEDEEEDPYPLEGKYADEADMQRLLDLPEIEREEIIASRMEERQKILDRKAIAALVKKQQQEGDSDGGATGVARAAKRQHTARGATKEKTGKLDELKAKRKAKDEKSKNRTHSPKRDRSSSPMDMETSSESDDEDGVITKHEEEEERERRLINGGGRNSTTKKDETPASLEDLERCRLNRPKLVMYMLRPWFPQYVKGAFVRYLIGEEFGAPIYRICQISQLIDEPVKPYKIDENKMFDRQAELVHGKARRNFNLDRVSNDRFNEREFNRFVKVCLDENVPFPTKESVDVKLTEMKRLVDQPLTESDVTSMLDRGRALSSQRPPGWVKLERSRLIQAKTLAERRQDSAEVAELDAQIVEFDSMYGREKEKETDSTNGMKKEENGAGTTGIKTEKGQKSKSGSDVLMRLSEKNRKANLEAVRKAEQQELERKRRERHAARNGSGTSTPVDPSARLKIVPRTLLTPTPGPTRPSTPGTPASVAPSKATPSIAASPAPSSIASFEASVIDAVDIDLGDF